MNHSLSVKCDTNVRSNWLDKGTELAPINLSINPSTYDTLTASPCTPGTPLTPMNLSINQSMTPTPLNQSFPLSPNPLSLQPSQSNSPRRRPSQLSNQSNNQSPHTRVTSLDSATSHLHRRPRSSILIWPSLTNSVVLPSLSQLASLSFNSFDWTEDQLLQSTLNVLNDLDLVSRLCIDLPALQCFLVAIKHKYRHHPYHNFYHGFSVFQFGYYMIKTSRLVDVLSPMDQLACLISCYCHDVDHPGTTNCLHPDTKVLRVKQSINQLVDHSTDQSIDQTSIDQLTGRQFEVESVCAGDLTSVDLLIDEHGQPCSIDCLDKQTVTDRLFTINQSRGSSYTVSSNHRLTLEATGPQWSKVSNNLSNHQFVQWRYWIASDDKLYERCFTIDQSIDQSDDALANNIDAFTHRFQQLNLQDKPLMKGDRFDLIVDAAHDLIKQSVYNEQSLPFVSVVEYPPPLISNDDLNIDAVPALSTWLNVDAQSIEQSSKQSNNNHQIVVLLSGTGRSSLIGTSRDWIYKPVSSCSDKISIDLDMSLSELHMLNQTNNQSDNDFCHSQTPSSFQALQDVWNDLDKWSHDFTLSLHLPQRVDVTNSSSNNQTVDCQSDVVLAVGPDSWKRWNNVINQSNNHTIKHVIADIEVIQISSSDDQSIKQTVVLAPSTQSVSQLQQLFIAHHIAYQIASNQSMESIKQSINSDLIPSRLLGPHPKPPTSHILSIDETISPAHVVALKAMNPSSRFMLADGTVTHNSFQVAVDSALARIHNNIAVLENHHAFVTCELLRDSRCNFLCNQNLACTRRFKKALVASILSTDMAVHVDLCHSFPALGTDLDVFDLPINAPSSNANAPNPKRETISQLALNLITHSSDLSAQCMDWMVARAWEEKVTAEFIQQSSLEQELGLPLSAWMVGLTGLATRYKAHVEFLQYVMDPLWTVVAQCLPQMKPAYDNLAKNRVQYIALRDAATDEPQDNTINQTINQTIKPTNNQDESTHLSASQQLMETDLLPPSSTSVSQLNSPERALTSNKTMNDHSNSESEHSEESPDNHTQPNNQPNTQTNNQSNNHSVDGHYDEDHNMVVDSYLVYYVALARP